MQTLAQRLATLAAYLADKVAENGKQDEQREAGGKGREAPTPAAGHVDDRLADHRAAAHAAEQAVDRVGDALADAFPVTLATGFSDLIDQA